METKLPGGGGEPECETAGGGKGGLTGGGGQEGEAAEEGGAAKVDDGVRERVRRRLRPCG